MRFMAGFVYAEVYAFKSNTFVARVLHFSAFMLQVICMLEQIESLQRVET